ncbi:MAG TPA: prohibitin family protein, partial [Accumulibacter sp.]|nr:prohibitin family protein [Accumulibacter sp.]HNN83255.1 prohibitin family protein [Accumulibacter sp.]
MKAQFTKIVQRLREALDGVATTGAPLAASSSGTPRQRAVRLIAIGGLAAAAYALYAHPPMQSIDRGEIGVRLNQFTG